MGGMGTSAHVQVPRVRVLSERTHAGASIHFPGSVIHLLSREHPCLHVPFSHTHTHAHTHTHTHTLTHTPPQTRTCALANLHHLPASIKDIYHERAWLETSISLVRVKIVVEVSDKLHGRMLLRALRSEGYRIENTSVPYNTEPEDVGV
jgi:hypothetical protein